MAANRGHHELTVNAKLDANTKITEFDGRVAAEITIDGVRWFVTSPNSDWIPEYPTVPLEGIYRRLDGRWGGQEYSRWPQLHTTLYGHQACIPWRDQAVFGKCDPPIDPVVWRNITPVDWEPARTFSGLMETESLGFIRSDIVDLLAAALAREQLHVEDFELRKKQNQTTASQTTPKFSFAAQLIAIGSMTLKRLREIAMTLKDSVFTFCELQRIVLELRGHLVHQSVVAPRLHQQTGSAHSLLPVRGVFCLKASDVQSFFLAGIPVWFIRPSSHVTIDTRIFRVVLPRQWKAQISNHPWRKLDGTPLIEPLTSAGSVGIRASTDNMINDTGMAELLKSMRSSLSSSTSLPEPVTRQLIPSTSIHTRPSQIRNTQGRASVLSSSKFSRTTRPVHHSSKQTVDTAIQPMLDVAHLEKMTNLAGVTRQFGVWLDALGNNSPVPVDDSISKTYFFPPPWKVVNCNDTLKTSRLLFNVVRIREFLPKIATKNHSFVLIDRLSGQDWSWILNGDYTRTDNLSQSGASPDLVNLDGGLPKRSSDSKDGATRPAKRQKKEWDGGDDSTKKNKINRHAMIRMMMAVDGNFSPVSYLSAVTWRHGRKISVQDIEADAALREEIVWFVCENAFHMELVELDKVMTSSEGCHEAGGFITRLQMAARCWDGLDELDGSVTQFVNIDKFYDDLWTRPIHPRIVHAFWQLLREWPDFPASLANFKAFDAEKREVDGVAAKLADFYVKKFVQAYSRLPTLPRYVPETLHFCHPSAGQ